MMQSRKKPADVALGETERAVKGFFWNELFSREILKSRQSLAKELENTKDINRIIFVQGQLCGLDLALSLPEKIIKQLKEELK